MVWYPIKYMCIIYGMCKSITFNANFAETIAQCDYITEINSILGLIWRYYGIKAIFWTIGEYSYLYLSYSYITLKDICVLVRNNGYG